MNTFHFFIFFIRFLFLFLFFISFRQTFIQRLLPLSFFLFFLLRFVFYSWNGNSKAQTSSMCIVQSSISLEANQSLDTFVYIFFSSINNLNERRPKRFAFALDYIFFFFVLISIDNGGYLSFFCFLFFLISF